MKDTNDKDDENPFNKLLFPSQKTKAQIEKNKDKNKQIEFLQRKRSDVNKILDNSIFSEVETTLIENSENRVFSVNNPIDIIQKFEKSNNVHIFKQSFHEIAKRTDSFTYYSDKDSIKSSVYEESLRDGLILLTYIMGGSSE